MTFMKQQHGPIPKTIQLANTLAQRIVQLRELRNMTLRDLARCTRFGVRRIEDIQSGLETWLSSADRQVLAKALTVDPSLIEEVEVRLAGSLYSQITDIPEAVIYDLGQAIISGTKDLNCPICGNKLDCSIQEGFDMEGNSVRSPKAHCIKCPFVLRL
jgi:transcriptional regulator with XRE-family HTH domain